MLRPPPIPNYHRNSIFNRSNTTNYNYNHNHNINYAKIADGLQCTAYYAPDNYGKLKYFVEADLQGYPEKDLQITKYSNHIEIKFNFHEFKLNGENCKHDFRHEIYFPTNVNLQTLNHVYTNRGTIIFDAYVDTNTTRNNSNNNHNNNVNGNSYNNHRQRQSFSMSPNSKRHINWGNSSYSSSPSQQSKPLQTTVITPILSPSLHNHTKLRSSFTSETNNQFRFDQFKQSKSINNQSKFFEKHNSVDIPIYSFNRTNNNPNHNLNNMHNSPIKHHPIQISTNQDHNFIHRSNSIPNNLVGSHKSDHYSPFKQSDYTSNYHSPSNLNNYNHYNNKFVPHPNHVHKHQMNTTSNIKQMNNNHNNAIYGPNEHIFNSPSNNNNNKPIKVTKFYVQSLNVGNHVTPNDITMRHKNGILIISVKNIQERKNSKTCLNKEIIHEHTLPMNVDVYGMRARLENGTLIWEVPYTYLTIDHNNLSNIFTPNSSNCEQNIIPIWSRM